MRVTVSGQMPWSPHSEALRRLASRPSLAVIAALLTLGAAQSAGAAPVDAPTATRIAIEVLSLGPKADNAKIKNSYGPDIKVEAKGDSQLVTVPSPTYVFGKDGENKVAFDSLAVLIGPSTDSNGHPRYPVTYQTPVSPTITEGGKPAAKMSFGSFDMSGTYAPELSSFLGFKGAMGDVVFNDPTSTDMLKVKGFTLDQNATEDSGTVSGQNIGSFKGIDLTSSDGTINIGEIRETITGTKVAIAPWLDAMRRIGAMMPQSPAEKPDQAVVNQQIKAGLDIAEKLPPLADNVGGQMTITDLKVAMKDSPPFAISSVGFGLSYQRPSPGLGDAQIDMSMAGLAIPKEAIATMVPPDTAPALLDMIPNGMHMTLGVKGAPTQRIVAELIKAGRTYTDTTDQSTMDSGLQAVNAALGSAHSQVAFSLDLASIAVKVVATTALVVDDHAAFGVTGTGKITLTGVDQEMAKLRGSNDPTAQQASAVMTMVKGMGTPRPAGSDIVYDYAILVTQEGKLTVNGQDLGAMMGGGAPADAPAPAAPPPAAGAPKGGADGGIRKSN